MKNDYQARRLRIKASYALIKHSADVHALDNSNPTIILHALAESSKSVAHLEVSVETEKYLIDGRHCK